MLTFVLLILLYVVSLYYIYTLLYIEKERKKTGQVRAEEQAEEKEEREPGRRMPPTSSPVPRLSSAPSAASTVLTIASRSPPHPLATSPRVREGRSPRPLLGDVIATISPPIDQQGIASTVCHPARLVLFPVPSSRL